jgi:hypothetical protein
MVVKGLEILLKIFIEMQTFWYFGSLGGSERKLQLVVILGLYVLEFEPLVVAISYLFQFDLELPGFAN